MKLLREIVEDVRILTEETAEGKKRHYVEGIFLQGDIKNRNGRRYPFHILEGGTRAYNENYVGRNRAWGELGHPDGPTINLDRVCLLIKEMKQDKSNYIGKALITSTPMGQVLEGLILDGGNVGVSSRAMGTLKEGTDGVMEVQNDFTLSAVDAVADPSAPDAWVRGVMENAEWVYSEQHGWRMAEAADNQRKQFQGMTIQQIQESKVAAFEKWLRSVS